MSDSSGSLVDRLLHRRALRRWARVAAECEALDPPSLRRLTRDARQLRSRLDRALEAARRRMAEAAPLPGEVPLALHTDWAWRPAPWRGVWARPGLVAPAPGSELAEGVKLFHDCPRAEIVCREMPSGGAASALALEVFGFEGSFLSVAVDLPEAAARTLERRHVVVAFLDIEAERPVEVFARLNIRHGPNTDQIVRSIPPENGRATAEFDLALTQINERRIEGAWLDLILSAPGMNRFLLRDLVLSRHPRAEF